MEITCGIYLYSIPLKKILACHAARTAKTNWSIPKGIRDEGEDSFTGALRELYEETAIDLRHKKIKPQRSFEPVKYRTRNKWLESFLLVVDTDFHDHHFVCHTLVEDKFPEIDKWEWISLKEAENRLHDTQRVNIPAIREILDKM
jgi:8-oxo-dGTP pyrophosphatase MutT (NUDIX family)